MRGTLLPELPLLALGLVAVLVPAIRDAVATVPMVGPAAGVLACLVGALTRRPRAAAAGLLIGMLAPLVEVLPAGHPGLDVLAAAVVLDLALIAALGVGADVRRVLAWGAAIVALEVAAIATAADPDSLITPIVTVPLLPESWRDAMVMPDVAVAGALLVVVGAGVAGVLRGDVVARAVAWSTPLLVFGFSAAAMPMAAAAAGLLVMATLVAGVHAMAYRDALTGLPGRRAFDETLAGLRPPYAVAAVDVDHFKRVNDTHGHDVGDQVLRMVAEQLGRVGGRGRTFRVGGEEFCVVFTGVGAEQVEPVLSELRERIEANPFRLRGPDRPRKRPKAPKRRKSAPVLPVTVSMGLAEAGERHLPAGVVLEAADKALYRAKEAGRNRVVLAVKRDYPKAATPKA